MKKYTVLSMLTFVVALSSFGFAAADSWNLPGVTIVTREEWGADESWKYTARPEYQAMLSNETDKYVSEAEEEQQKQDAEKSRIARQFGLEHFPQDLLMDKVIDLENGNDLWWSLEYKYNKSKVIVHHTTNDLTKIRTEDDMKALMQSVYKYHAFSNGWGDVGYNFIISPSGVVYEGRAGGEGVIGAHASWNNQPSVGIALVGNFNIDKPTDAQINALIKLITSLSQKYNIDPESKTDWHKKSSAYPYVSTFQNYTVVGHRDVGATACPGESLYKLLPAIRDSVENNLKRSGYLTAVTTQPTTSSSTPTKPADTRPTLPLAPNSQKSMIGLAPVSSNAAGIYMVRTRTANMGTTLPKCQISSKDLIISGCMYRSGELIVGVKKRSANVDPGEIIITATSRTSQVTLSVELISTTTTTVKPSTSTTSTVSSPVINNPLLEQRRQLFSLPAISANIKIALPTSAADAPSFMKKDMRVLLYNASMLSSSWIITCTGLCSMSDAAFTKLTVSYTGGMLSVQKNNGLVWKENGLTAVASSGSTLTITDALTQKQYGIYRGKLDILQQQIKKIDGNYVTQYALINSLPLEHYLAGIAEASDAEPMEKTKVLALLTKAYALYYVGGSSAHPSIPKGVVYNSIDDPRFFQKYVGVAWEQRSKNRGPALAQTKDEYVVYNNILPILPYFHCSPGFTWSAREKWGWNDTPYLQSVLDDSGCTTFEGHGVGLSGQGATKKAKDGLTAADILAYYYPGTTLQTIK